MFKSKMGHFQTGVLEYNKGKGEKKRVWSLCVCFFAQSHKTFPRMPRAEKDKVNNINTVCLTSAQLTFSLFFLLLPCSIPDSLCLFATFLCLFFLLLAASPIHSGTPHRPLLWTDVPRPCHLLHWHPVHDHHHRQRHRQGGILRQLHHPREEPPPGPRGRG